MSTQANNQPQLLNAMSRADKYRVRLAQLGSEENTRKMAKKAHRKKGKRTNGFVDQLRVQYIKEARVAQRAEEAKKRRAKQEEENRAPQEDFFGKRKTRKIRRKIQEQEFA